MGYEFVTCGIPPIRKELFQLGHRRGSDVGQHAGEVALGIKTVAFGAGHEAEQHSGGVATGVGSANFSGTDFAATRTRKSGCFQTNDSV